MPDGMTLAIAAVHDGFHPEMPIADVLTADGETVQFEIPRRAILQGGINIGWPVGQRNDGAMLVDLGTQYGCLTGGRHFGANRIYVPRASLRPAQPVASRDGDRGEGT